MNIAEKLKELRENKGITQTELIKEIEKTQNISIAISSIKNYENVNNPRIPQGDILLALARYYNVSLESLIDDKIEQPLKKENLEIGKELKINEYTINNIKYLNELYITNTFNNFCTSSIFIDFFDYLYTYEKIKLFCYKFFILNQLSLTQTKFGYILNMAKGTKYAIPQITFEHEPKHYMTEKEEQEYINKYSFNVEKIVKNKKQIKIVFNEYLKCLNEFEKEKTYLIGSRPILSNNEYNEYKQMLEYVIKTDDDSENDIENRIKSIVLFFNQLYYSILTTQDMLEFKINKMLSKYMEEL